MVTDKKQEKTMLAFALEYAKAGYKVIPVAGKRPTTPNGKDDASSSAAVITAWWTSNPEAGIGVLIPDDVVVVDIDSKDALAAFDSFGFSLPATIKAKSKRGFHFWYRRTGTAEAIRRINVMPGVDLLVNGYVVAPPTPYISGNGSYEWEVDLFTGEMSDAPSWLEEYISDSNRNQHKIQPEEILKGAPAGSRQTTLFRYACSLRARGKTSKQEARVLVREAARNSEGGDKDFNENYVTEMVDRVWKTYDKSEKQEEEKAPSHVVYSLADLSAKTLDPAVHLVKNILPATGYTLLTSPPKTGKSAFGALLAASVATGKKLWSKIETKQVGVLYLDLEQFEYEALERWKGILKEIGQDSMPANLYTAFTWDVMDEGGLELIKEFLVDHPHVGLVVIDTLADFWPADEGRASNAYHREQKIVKNFTTLSRDFGCAVLVVHHDKKGDSQNLVGKASGTYALSGKAASILHIERGDGLVAALEIIGKNVPQSLTHMRLDVDTMTWKKLNA